MHSDTANEVVHCFIKKLKTGFVLVATVHASATATVMEHAL